jgi:hypothetical protein
VKLGGGEEMIIPEHIEWSDSPNVQIGRIELIRSF